MRGIAIDPVELKALKIGEFIDTILKVMMAKKLIFLHWYHHLMTAWLGWLSLAYDAAPGQWYAGINCE